MKHSRRPKDDGARHDAELLARGVRSGDRGALARAITLVESRREADAEVAETLLDLCTPFAGQSIRVGFSGVPGAGKSTLIEALGIRLIDQGHRIAVLAIDPSSGRSGGSILGDKTRMERLSRSPDAFIRPSPSRGSLGGVAPHTRETIILCEAAGYDLIFVETVGVGQSEAEVARLADFVMLLLVTGAGDELQAIKRGLVEFADALIVTKADSGNELRAAAAVETYRGTLGLFADRESGWTPRILAVSAHDGEGLGEIWSLVTEFRELAVRNGYWQENRRRQQAHWLREGILSGVQEWISSEESIRQALTDAEASLLSGEVSLRRASRNVLRAIRDRR